MLDIKFIRENPAEVKESVRRRGLEVNVDRILELDQERRELIPEIEGLRAEQNKISEGKGKPGEKEIARAKNIKEKLSQLEPELKKVEKELEDLLLTVPNLLHPKVPDGKDQTENVEIGSWGGKPGLDFEPKDHQQIGQELDIIDIKRAAKVSGADFYFLKNEGALLEMALVNFTLDLLAEKGFTPIITPELVREEVATGVGYIPRREEPDIYKIKGEDLWLSATAEIPLTGFHMNQILEQQHLPRKYVGFSSCFRKESGAYGKHKKGIFRVHQFDKVEIYQFVKGDLEYSEPAFKDIVDIEQQIYQKLKIPYRVVTNCTGDISAPAFIKQDLEYWSPVDRQYRELTSCSNCTDFQARRLNIRYRNRKGNIRFVHTLNGTAVTSTRTIIAILENFQQKDGSVKNPEVLQEYTGFKEIKAK